LTASSILLQFRQCDSVARLYEPQQAFYFPPVSSSRRPAPESVQLVYYGLIFVPGQHIGLDFLLHVHDLSAPYPVSGVIKKIENKALNLAIIDSRGKNETYECFYAKLFVDTIN